MKQAKTIRAEWLEDGPAAGPLAEKPKTLGEIERAKASTPPPPLPLNPSPIQPAPVPTQEPLAPMTPKEVGNVLEVAGKAVLDASLALQKAFVALSKIKTMTSQTGKDRAIVSTSSVFIEDIAKMMARVEALASSIGEFREGLVKPEPAAKDWLG